MGDQPEKKPKRLGGLNSGVGRTEGRLGGVRNADGAGPSHQAAAGAAAPAGLGGSVGGGAAPPRKMRFMPTNFARVRKTEDSASTDVTSISVSKSEGFEDLMRAAQNDRDFQRHGRGRGRGRGAPAPGRGHTTVTVFGGGVGEGQGGRRPAARAGSSGGSWGAKGRGGAAISAKPSKAGAAAAAGGGAAGVKEEADLDMGFGDLGFGGPESDSDEEAARRDPLDYTQYHPTVLPFRQPGMACMDDSGAAGGEGGVPPDILSIPEDTQAQQSELEFLQDIESNDGRLMLFQLPSALPIPMPHTGPSSSAAGAESRPGMLSELPTSRIGKLLVFESGAIKMQIGDVLLDVAPGVPCQFRQDVAVVSTSAKQLVMLAPVAQRVVCSPDLETLLSDEPLPQWERAPGVGQQQQQQQQQEQQEQEEQQQGEQQADGADGVEAMEVDGEEARAAAAKAKGKQKQQQPEVKEEPEVNSPRARGVPRNRK